MFEKNRGFIKQKKEKTVLEKIFIPIFIALIDLAVIIALVLIFKNKTTIIIAIVLGQLALLVYLAKILEREKISKEKERKQSESRIEEEMEKYNIERQKRIEAEKKIKQEKKIEKIQMILKITNMHELKNYIGLALKQKFSPKEIKEALLKVGWSEDKIDQMFDEVLK